MFTTKIGPYDGDSWEQIIKICLKDKYKNEQYQDCPATTNGDMGIEGYTLKTGKVFQCYCPDFDTDNKKLYENQRDKITTDISKLEDNKEELCKHFKKNKIKEWIFITPRFENKDLLLHCRKKEDEVLLKNLDFIDDSFKILIHTIDDYINEINFAMSSISRKISLEIETPNIEDINLWYNSQNDLVNNSNRKNLCRFQPGTININTRINKLTDKTIESYLTYSNIINSWKELYPEQYEKFILCISNYESIVEAECIIPSNTHNEVKERLDLIKNKLEELLKSTFPNLDILTITNLTEGVISDWILRCPINFD